MYRKVYVCVSSFRAFIILSAAMNTCAEIYQVSISTEALPRSRSCHRQALIWNFGSFKVQSSKLLKTFAVFNMWPDTCLTWLPLFCIYWCYLSLLRCSVRVSISNRRASICACFALHSSRSPSKDRSLHLMQKRNWFLQASSRHEGQKDWQSPYPHTVASFSAIARFVQHDRQYLTSQTLHSSVAEQPVHRISLQWVQNE